MAMNERIPLVLHLRVEDIAACEDLLDNFTHCSRHRLLVACVRRGLREFQLDPAEVIELLPAQRGVPVRLRSPPERGPALRDGAPARDMPYVSRAGESK